MLLRLPRWSWWRRLLFEERGNVTLNAGAGGATAATDDVGGVSYQKTKQAIGPGGTASLATAVYHVVAAGSNNAANIKAQAAHLYAVHVLSAAAYPVFVKLYNKATAPAPNADTPVAVVGVPPGAARDVRYTPADFPTGLGIAIVKNIADTDNTPVLASDVVVDVEYAF